MFDDLASESVHRPPTDFGTPGAVAHFKGPYSGGPPRAALEVETPTLDKFGLAEISRMVLIYFVLITSVLRRLVTHVLRRRGQSWARVAAEGAVDGFEILGPTFVKLGQLIASSPSLFPAPFADAA